MSNDESWAELEARVEAEAEPVLEAVAALPAAIDAWKIDAECGACGHRIAVTGGHEWAEQARKHHTDEHHAVKQIPWGDGRLTHWGGPGLLSSEVSAQATFWSSYDRSGDDLAEMTADDRRSLRDHAKRVKRMERAMEDAIFAPSPFLEAIRGRQRERSRT